MAINKNFVIKNGVQVATDLIVGDSDTKRVGIGTTIAGYTLHVGATNIGGRGGIGVTDAVITGVGTIKDLLVTGYSGFSSDVSVSGIVSAQSFGIGTTEIIDRGMRLSGIASLDAVTTATIEEAIRVGPNSFSDLKVSGISTFVGIATFATGLNVVSGVSTFGAPLRIGFAGTTDHAGVALGATVGFGTSAFFQDGAAIYFGDDSDLKIFHDSSNSFIQDLGTGNLYVDSNSLQIRNATGTETQATFTENGAVSLFYDDGNVFQTTPQGINVSGVTTSNRLNISGVSTLTSIGSNLIPDTDGSRNIGAASSEWQDLFIDGTANIDTLAADTAAIADLTDNRVVIAGSGGELEDDANFTFDGAMLKVGTAATIAVNGNAAFAGVTTVGGALDVNSTSNFADDVTFQTDNTNNIVLDKSGNKLVFGDNIIIKLGSGEDGELYHDGSHTYLKDVGTGNLRLAADDAIFIQKNTGGETIAKFIPDGAVELYHNDVKTVETTADGILVGTGVTIQKNGNIAASGITTIGGNLLTGGDILPDEDGSRDLGSSSKEFQDLFIDGTANIDTLAADTAAIADLTDNRVVIAGSSGELEDDANLTFDGAKFNVGSGVTIQPHGGVSIAGIVTIGGNLNVQGDIVYDEITGRNLNITGISTQAGQVNFGTSGVGATIAANGNATFAGIVTAAQFQGGGVGVGIGSTTGLVGYGFTFIQFQGPGITTVYADARPGFTGLATVFIQGGGGGVGAAGTWQNDGVGISTAKSVGVNTSTLNDPDLQGTPHVGAGGSFKGLYVGNGMIVNDNQLNGDHYIGTAFGGMMAGPVTINGVLTVDGNYVVV